MEDIFIVIGIILMIIACSCFIAGWLLLRREKRELEEYLYNVYGERKE